MALMDGGAFRGGKAGQTGQNKVPKTQGIAGDERRLADPLQIAERLDMGLQGLPDFFRRQPRGNFLRQFFRTEKQGEMIHRVTQQFRKKLPHGLKPDLTEETAFPHPLFDQSGGADEAFRVSFTLTQVHHDPVLNRVMAENITAVGQNGIILGERIQNIGVEPEAMNADGKERRDRHDNQRRQNPPEKIRLLLHDPLILMKGRMNHRRIIRRLNVSAFLKKSTKAR